MNTQQNSETDRLIWADLLRVIAIAGIVLLHASSCYWKDYSVFSDNWTAMALYDSLARWALPIFIMISGMLFIGHKTEVSIKTLYSKYILRIVLVFIVWSLFYTFISYAPSFLRGEELCPVTVLKSFLRGYYHLWFLYMIAGLYMVVPFLRKIAEEKILCIYLVILNFIFGLFIPFILSFSAIKYGALLDKTFLYFPLGFAGYFMWGYYIDKYSDGWSARSAKLIYALGLLCAAATFLGTFFFSRSTDIAQDKFFDNLSPLHFFVSTAVFLAFKRINEDKLKKYKNPVMLMSSLSLGIYLAHPFFLLAFKKFSLYYKISDNFFISIPLAAIFIFVISAAVIFLIKKIKIADKLV